MCLILSNPYQSNAMFYGSGRQAASRVAQGWGKYGQGLSRFMNQGFRGNQPFMGHGRSFSSRFLPEQSQKFLGEAEQFSEQKFEMLKRYAEQYERMAMAKAAIEKEANAAARMRMEAEAARMRTNAQLNTESARLATMLGMGSLATYLGLKSMGK